MAKSESEIIYVNCRVYDQIFKYIYVYFLIWIPVRKRIELLPFVFARHAWPPTRDTVVVSQLIINFDLIFWKFTMELRSRDVWQLFCVVTFSNRLIYSGCFASRNSCKVFLWTINYVWNVDSGKNGTFNWTLFWICSVVNYDNIIFVEDGTPFSNHKRQAQFLEKKCLALISLRVLREQTLTFYWILMMFARADIYTEK